MTKTLSAEEFVQQVSDALPHSVAAEREQLLRYARAWADVSYPEQLPAELNERLKTLEAAWQRQTI
jgi:hypothetical protein